MSESLATGMLKNAFAKSITVNHFALGGTADKTVTGFGTIGALACIASFTNLRS